MERIVMLKNIEEYSKFLSNKICHYFNITIEQLFISEEDFSKDRDIIDLLIFNIIRYGE